MGSDTSGKLDLELIKRQLADEAYDDDHFDEWYWLFHEDPEIRQLMKERSERIRRRLLKKLGVEEQEANIPQK